MVYRHIYHDSKCYENKKKYFQELTIYIIVYVYYNKVNHVMLKAGLNRLNR